MNQQPIRLADSFKTYTYDQDKTRSPLDTVAHFRERLQQAKLDVLKEVRRIDNGRLDIPVYFSVCGKDAYETIGNKKQMGKGSTPEQSQASACMELAERFSFFAFKRNPRNFLTATYAELKAAGRPLLGLDKLLQSVHDTAMNEEMLEKLLADIPIQWTWATHLNSQEEVLIPFSWFYAINEFNGPSAGNTYEEAISQGICELIERHVCSLISHHRLTTPIIDLASIEDPVARELISKFTRNGIELYLNDFSLDTGIPTVGAMAIDRSTFPHSSEIVFTAGTTPGPVKALIRALTEVAQLAGDFNSKSNYVASGLPKPLSMEEVDYVTEGRGTIRLDEMPDLQDDNIRVEIERMLEVLAKRGMEVYIVNTMHPQLRIPTIYTIIPGAHFRERSMLQDAGLFAAKLLTERLDSPVAIDQGLLRMQEHLPRAYYLEFYRGRHLQQMGRQTEAVAHLQKALTMEPAAEDLPYIYAFLGDCLKDMAQYPEAVEALQKGLHLDEERPDLHNLLGFCHFKLEEYESAVRHFGRAVELNPASAIDHANLGVNYRKLNRTEEAISSLQLALSLDPTIDFAREHLVQLSR